MQNLLFYPPTVQLMKPGQLTAMISSTARDLPEHRQMVMDACLRLGIEPVMMEHLAGQDASAKEVSIRLTKRADVYLGIFAHAYGSTPPDDPRSYTEIEFDEAVRLGIPVVPFFMHDDHPWKVSLVDKGRKGDQLDALKARVEKGRTVQKYKSPEDLRGLVIHALSEFSDAKNSGGLAPPDLHPINIIPKRPEPYIAHPYSLLQTKNVIGRRTELNLLTDWVTKNQTVPADTRIFTLVAIGGMGKSALTWKWFNDIAPKELPHLAGRMWWSFYESDAHWENFIIRALAYVSGQPEKAVRELKSPDREDHLFHFLDTKSFLVVLDGLERILLAYARMDAAQMLDDDLDEKTANLISNDAIPLPTPLAPMAAMGGEEKSKGDGAAGRSKTPDSSTSKHQLRLATDHRAGQFLRRLSRIKGSRILITTRLYPADFETKTGKPLPNCFVTPLTGLSDDDALSLWRAFDVTGSREHLLSMFRSFDNYPLLISALAGEVAEYKPSPRNFDNWRADHPDFNPEARTHLRDTDRKAHILEYALRGLGDTHRKVLHTIAAFRTPATWVTLRALLVQSESVVPRAPSVANSASFDALHVAPTAPGMRPLTSPSLNLQLSTGPSENPCATNQIMDTILTELEDRGLVGWDRNSNRYDLHPIVRSVIWSALEDHSRQALYTNLHTYFDALPKPSTWDSIETIEALSPAIELYGTLIGLKRFDDAWTVFCEQIHRASFYRLANYRQRRLLLEELWAEHPPRCPRLTTEAAQSAALVALGRTNRMLGEPLHALGLFRHAVDLFQADRVYDHAALLHHLADSARLSAKLRNAECASRQGIKIGLVNKVEPSIRAGYRGLALVFAAKGEFAKAKSLFEKSISVTPRQSVPQVSPPLCSYHGHVAQLLLWQKVFELGKEQALLAISAGQNAGFKRGTVRALRLYGEALLGCDDLLGAANPLNQALLASRDISFVEEELPTLTSLAELHRRKQEFAIARELLDQVWDLAERGPYPLFHADALNVLAQVEHAQNDPDAAVAAATKAYTLAWCDGPPYAYHYGLTTARKHLLELGVPEPQLPAFDESKFPSLPEVELNPKDEFWVDPEKLNSGEPPFE